MLDKLDDRLDEGELTGINPPRNICSCWSLIDPIKLCNSGPSRLPKSAPRTPGRPPGTPATPAPLAELAAPRSPAPLALVTDEEAEPGAGGLFNRSFTFFHNFSSFSVSVSFKRQEIIFIVDLKDFNQNFKQLNFVFDWK